MSVERARNGKGGMPRGGTGMGKVVEEGSKEAVSFSGL